MFNQIKPSQVGLLRVRRGRWYKAVNRVGGVDDPKRCVHLRGHNSNLTYIVKAYLQF